MISLACEQPVHLCSCLDCDDERRAAIRETATRLQAKYAYVQPAGDDSGETYCGPTARPGRMM